MKTRIVCPILLFVSFLGFSQTSFSQDTNQEPIAKFALSLNPLGFVQFGPVISAEFGVKDDIAINTHVRIPTLGVLSWVIRDHSDGLDEMSGIAFGGGLLKFFGENQHKPYMGVLLEYDQFSAEYALGEQWEWYKDEKAIVFIFNGGYRFRFGEGFFINTGAYLGAATGRYQWEYSDVSYGTIDSDPREGTSVTPFGMLEVTVGLEF